MKETIIGTGLSGLVGSRIVQLLSKQFNFVDFSLDTGVDITDFKLLKSKFNQFPQAKAVLHLAAFTNVNSAWEQKGDKNGLCYRVNVLGTRNISQLAKQTNKYLIHISTDFVFDGHNPPQGGYKEEDQPNPIEWYGQTKYWAEQEVEKSTGQSVILRIAFPYKAQPAPQNLEPQVKLDLVRKIIDKLKKKEQLTMFADQIITPTFIDDIVQVINRCLQKKTAGIFHCTGSTSLSPYNLALKIAQTFNLNQSLIKSSSLKDYLKTHPDSRPRQINMELSNKKIEKELKIKMLTIDQGLREIKEATS